MLPSYAASYVKQILQVAHQLGASREILLAHADLTESELTSPSHRISQPQVLCLYQAASTLTGEPSLGLLVGESVRAESLHQLGYALMSCETVGEALALNLRFQPLIMGQGQFDMDLADDLVTLSWRPAGASPALLRPINESILASWVRFGQWITGSNATPLSVKFCHQRPADLVRYQKLFQCPLTFDAPSNSLTGQRFLLDLPLKQANPGLKQALLSALETQIQSVGSAMDRIHPNDWVERTRQMIRLTMNQPGEHLERIASSLLISERTLKRRLSDQGTSLRQLLEEERLLHAQRRLTESMDPIELIANELGYRSLSAFTQAFQKWKGMPPSRLRRLEQK